VSSATVLMLPTTHSQRGKLQPAAALLDEIRCDGSTRTSSVIDHLHVQRHGSGNHSVASLRLSTRHDCVLAHRKSRGPLLWLQMQMLPI